MDLFTAQPNSMPKEVLAHVPRRVTDEMNEALESPYSVQEVERALSMMGASKAPIRDLMVLQWGSTKNIGRPLVQVSRMRY